MSPFAELVLSLLAAWGLFITGYWTFGRLLRPTLSFSLPVTAHDPQLELTLRGLDFLRSTKLCRLEVTLTANGLTNLKKARELSARYPWLLFHPKEDPWNYREKN